MRAPRGCTRVAPWRHESRIRAACKVPVAPWSLAIALVAGCALATGCAPSADPAAGPAADQPPSATVPAGTESPAVATPTGAWPQWGGPKRDFTVADAGLAEDWPDAGPPVLWERALGEGYAGIALADDTLYTMLRRDGEEVVVALDADTGETLWEHAYPASTRGMDTSQGPGPHTTPLVAGDRLFTIGVSGSLRALDRTDGSLLWRVELWEELGGTFRDRGYSSSPMLHGDTVIALVGDGAGSVVAFDQRDGSVVWSGGDLDNGHASPIIIEVDGQEQVIAFLAGHVAGIETGTGRALWSIEHPTNWGLNISTPVWGEDGILYVSSAYSGGSRAIRLSRPEGGDGQPLDTAAEELWFSSQMRVHFGSVVRLGDTVYGSSGDFGPAFFTALDVPSGEVLWRDRAFAKASYVHLGDRAVLLDEDGTLALVRFDENGLETLARTELFDSLSWTVPSLAGTRLYARNRERITAVELGG